MENTVNKSEPSALGANIATNIWSILCITHGGWRTESSLTPTTE